MGATPKPLTPQGLFFLARPQDGQGALEGPAVIEGSYTLTEDGVLRACDADHNLLGTEHLAPGADAGAAARRVLRENANEPPRAGNSATAFPRSSSAFLSEQRNLRRPERLSRRRSRLPRMIWNRGEGIPCNKGCIGWTTIR
jgi:hypothetical protein